MPGMLGARGGCAEGPTAAHARLRCPCPALSLPHPHPALSFRSLPAYAKVHSLLTNVSEELPDVPLCVPCRAAPALHARGTGACMALVRCAVLCPP